MLGIGYSIGFAQSHFEYGAIAGLLILAFVFLPLYRKMGLYTLSEYLTKRYDARSGFLYSAFTIVTIVIVRMALGFYIGARALSYLLRGTGLRNKLRRGDSRIRGRHLRLYDPGRLEGRHLDRRHPIFHALDGGHRGRRSRLRAARGRRSRRPARRRRRAAGGRAEIPSVSAHRPPATALDRRVLGAADHPHLLLGDESIHRPARAGRAQRFRRQDGHRRGGLSEAARALRVGRRGHRRRDTFFKPAWRPGKSARCRCPTTLFLYW